MNIRLCMFEEPNQPKGMLGKWGFDSGATDNDDRGRNNHTRAA